MHQKITITATINAPIEKVWQYWTEPEHITKWAFASDEWEAPSAQNDVRVGGRFVTRLQATDGSQGFDFSGEYTEVIMHEKISSILDDERKAVTVFETVEDGTKIISTFEMESENPEETQRAGWQAILNNFKKQVEQE